MSRRPVAYVRRSSGKDSPASWEMQREAIRRAVDDRADSLPMVETLDEARRHLDWYVDWGQSGADPTRIAFLEMVADIESGLVSTVYVYHSDRLARRTATLAALLDTAEEAGVEIIDGSGQDLAAEEFRVAAEVTGSVSASEYRSIKRRNRARTERQRARGDQFGQPPYGYRRAERADIRNEPIRFERIPGHPLDDVIETVRRNHGNMLRSARELNAAGVPSPRGSMWGTATLSAIVAREAPELKAPGERRGRPPARPRYFTRLLRCPCGRLLSPSGAGKADHWTCRAGHSDPRHPRPYNVSESKILRWAKVEAARFRPPSLVEQGASDSQRRRAELERQRTRLRKQHQLGVIDDSELAASWEAIREELDGLKAQEAVDVLQLPEAVDWDTWAPEDVNRVLRAMWRYVELDESLDPVRAEWIVPAWRAE